MLRLSNISIGIKLAVMSGVGVLLVVAMVATEILGNASVQNSHENAIRRAKLAQGALQAKAAIRGMQIGVRDVRLASTPAELDTAKAYLADRKNASNAFLDQALAESSIPATIATLKATKSLVEEYHAKIKDIAAIKSEIFALQAKGSSADSAKQVAALEQKAAGITHDVTLPIAVRMDDSISKLATGVVERMDETAAQAAQAMAASERISLAVGLAVVVVLVGSTIAGILSIGKPMRALVQPLEDLAHGNFAVEVPGATARTKWARLPARSPRWLQKSNGR